MSSNKKTEYRLIIFLLFTSTVFLGACTAKWTLAAITTPDAITRSKTVVALPSPIAPVLSPTLPQSALDTPTHIPTSTGTPIPPAIAPAATPTTGWDLQVTEFEPSRRCGAQPGKQIFLAAWKSEAEFTYGYFPILKGDGSQHLGDLHWASFNVETNEEEEAAPLINFNDSFWKRNQLTLHAVDDPELAGYFSPSGAYVIYNVWHGSVFDEGSRTEIWVAETHGPKRWKIYEFDYSNVYLYRAAWFDDETRVIFNASYEGPSTFLVSQFKTGATFPFGYGEFSGTTEETWRISPDGHQIAVVDLDRQLLLVPLNRGKIKIVEPYGGSFPQWAADGSYLYYWWRADRHDFGGEIDELRAYEVATGKTTTLLDRASLVSGFHPYLGDDHCLSRDYFLMNVPYAVSPNQQAILLWADGLYILRKR